MKLFVTCKAGLGFVLVPVDAIQYVEKNKDGHDWIQAIHDNSQSYLCVDADGNPAPIERCIVDIFGERVTASNGIIRSADVDAEVRELRKALVGAKETANYWMVKYKALADRYVLPTASTADPAPAEAPIV